MKNIEIKPNTRIKAKGVDISIGKRIDQVALISHFNDDFIRFTSIRKGGRLAKIKRKFKHKLCCSTAFFFEGLNNDDVLQLINILK